ncbi:MAG TPA: sigma-70 family RNA polymerase sigma factor [Gemmata sp.]|nr:sigma-70 family RNA polymerase sigma factor [Gemmata sp.]
MATATAPPGTLREVFDRLRDTAGGGDGELLTRYRTTRDQDAFGSLVRRHGPMVLGVCRRVLRDSHAADDAFQATFLVLARKADAVRPPDRLAPWLYGVAYRTAMKSRGRAFRRRQVEQDYASQVANRPAPRDDADLLPVIDEQLNALPEKYRVPLVLCGLQGLNKAEAAAKLGLPEGTVSSRLARARDLLRDRLTRRGVPVPAAALATLLAGRSLRAAVPHALANTTTSAALGAAAPPAAALSLSNEVIRSMTLTKLNFLGAVALTASLAGGGFYALRADDRKPGGEKPGVAKPEAQREKPRAEGQKPKQDGEKPREGEQRPARPAARGGKVASVDAKRNTITIAFKGDGGIVERIVELTADAKVFIDGNPGKLADVPVNSTAAIVVAVAREKELAQVSELRVTGQTVNGVVAKVEASGLTLDGEKVARTIPLAAGTKVTVNGRDAKAADLKAGDRVQVVMAADEKAALTVATGRAAGDGERPAAKQRQFAGKVAEVDATARTITLAARGEEGKPMVVKVTADAKISVDGKAAKLADVAKGATVTLGLSSAKDGQMREVNEVAVAGPTFAGSVKRIDATTITIGNERTDRVLKLAEGGTVMIGEKAGKLSDLKVGDRVTVTMTSDESAAVKIAAGAKRPTGDRPKGDKEKEDEPSDDN